MIRSFSASESTPYSVITDRWVTVPGAWVPLKVPSGSRCVKVLFTAVTDCPGSICYMRVLDGVQPISPVVGGGIAFDYRGATQEAHAFEWVRRVGPGNHLIAVQMREEVAPTYSPPVHFHLTGWTMDVTFTN